MKNLEGYMNFWPDFEIGYEATEEDYCFIYHQNQILIKNTDGLQVPNYGECEALIVDQNQLWYLGKWQGRACFGYALAHSLDNQEAISLANKQDEKKEEQIGKLQGLSEAELEDILETKNLKWCGFRDPRWNDNLDLYQICVKVQHLLNWDRSTKYCGCCGSLYERKLDERAKRCPKCGNLQFPRISPAIIVGVKKGNEILMAHNSGFREGLYSVIAGFVEQGENLETAVKREIYEEVGIKVKNIQYFQSRPWNSIDSLMIGFIAEYESGEIKVDGKEIVDARWCDKEHMPEVLPDKISTAWHIINEIIGLEE